MKRIFVFTGIFFLLLITGIFLPQKSQFTQAPATTNSVVVAPSMLPKSKEHHSPQPTLDLYSRSEDIPYDKLFITKERRNYKTGELTLIIPKLSLVEPVQNGTSTEALALGPGLYDYAQLPGEGDRNVSIAAHRNHSRNGVISEWFFYYIDTLEDGDYMYLTDANHIYRYRYDQTTIVEEDDWSPIYSQGFSCITLTSCEPIGVADHRIIVRGILDQITPYTASYVYEASQK